MYKPAMPGEENELRIVSRQGTGRPRYHGTRAVKVVQSCHPVFDTFELDAPMVAVLNLRMHLRDSDFRYGDLAC